jgi:acyl dehydratase
MSEPRLRSHRGVELGASLGERVFEVDRAQLIRYAGASLDFNPIHWSDAAARRSGLPDIIAHGMLTMALAGRLATDWAGDPASVVGISVRFSAVVAVPADASTPVRVTGSVAEKLDDDRVAVDLLVASGDREVLKRARAVLQLGP